MEFPPGYDPVQTNYISGSYEAIGALVVLLGLAELGAAVVGAELFSGGAVFTAETGGFATISLEDSNLIMENAILNSEAGQTAASFDLWKETTFDEMMTVNKYSNFVQGIPLETEGDFGAAFDSSVDDGFDDMQ